MIDVVDHFSLNQCRSEEITLKEDLGNEFLDLVDFGKYLCLLIGLSVIICYYYKLICFFKKVIFFIIKLPFKLYNKVKD